MVENAAYRHMSMWCGEFGFQWSRWNGDIGKERVALKVCRCTQAHWKKIQEDGAEIDQASTSPILVATVVLTHVVRWWWAVVMTMGMLS